MFPVNVNIKLVKDVNLSFNVYRVVFRFDLFTFAFSFIMLSCVLVNKLFQIKSANNT